MLYVPADLAVGKRWRTAFTLTPSNGSAWTTFWDFQVEALEEVQVLAGTFQAFKVVGNGEARYRNKTRLMSQTNWVDPVTMTPVRQHIKSRDAVDPNQVFFDDFFQLVSLKLVPR